MAKRAKEDSRDLGLWRSSPVRYCGPADWGDPVYRWADRESGLSAGRSRPCALQGRRENGLKATLNNYPSPPRTFP